MTTEIFADKQFPNDWHVETIDEKTGDIYQAVFAGPNAESRARKYGNGAVQPPLVFNGEFWERQFQS